MWDGPDAVTFEGLNGVIWHVVECASAGVPGARGPCCLIFFSEGTVRRIWEYPEEWRSLELFELESLMARV